MSRDTEMDWILAKLKRPEPAAFVLAGAPGVGKTRLAAEAAKSAAGLGFTTAQAVASRAAAAIPFGPFAPFLPEAGYSPGDLLGLLRKASDAILERAGPDRRLLLVVDDAQFLDEGSAALVHQLVQKGACSVLASLRTPGPAPEPVTALWKDGLAERIDLATWGEPETEAVLSAFLGGPVAIGSVRRLWEVSQGNALYLRELLIGAVDSGALTETGGIWSLSRPLTAPGRLVELDEALAVITDPAPRLQLLGRLATIKVFEPDLEGALAAAAPLLDTRDNVMVSRGAYVSSIALAMLGRSEEAVPLAYRGLESARRASGLVQLPEAQLIGAVFGHAAGGHLEKAEADARTGYQACLAAGDKERMATHLLLAGMVRIEQGQLTRASKVFLDAASVNREIHDPAALRWCLAGLASGGAPDLEAAGHALEALGARLLAAEAYL